MSEQTRAYAYRVATAVVPILVTYGLLAEGQAPLWLALITAVISAAPPALAAKHTSTHGQGLP